MCSRMFISERKKWSKKGSFRFPYLIGLRKYIMKNNPNYDHDEHQGSKATKFTKNEKRLHTHNQSKINLKVVI